MATAAAQQTQASAAVQPSQPEPAAPPTVAQPPPPAPPAAAAKAVQVPLKREEVAHALEALLKERIIYIDGAMGTEIQKYKLQVMWHRWRSSPVSVLCFSARNKRVPWSVAAAA